MRQFKILHNNFCSTLGLLFLLMVVDAYAKNIDLSTLPTREQVQLTIYNSEDLTLVRETRQISIKEGSNRLQFSWANTQIDPTSVQLDFISHQEQLHLTNTMFPHDKPQMLYWQINSQVDALVTVEISYFTSGITWKADYLGLFDQKNKSMALDSFITVTNQSGEDYENAEIRLVIGQINLVERVDELVKQSQLLDEELRAKKKFKYRHLARKMMTKEVGRHEMAPMPMSAAMADAIPEEKAVEKESLSEYYIFSIEGTETIKNQWSKRMRSSFADKVPVETIYRYRPREYGEQLARVMIFTNDDKASLGEAPLPAGTIQLYKKKDNNQLGFIKAIPVKYTSIGQKVELNTGRDPNIIFKLVNLKNWRNNIWMHYRKGNVYRRVDDGHIKVDHNSKVAGWNEHSLFVQHIKNLTDNDIKVEIRRALPGDVLFLSQLNTKKYDFKTVDITSDVAAWKKQELLYETITKKGRNAKQSQLKVKSKAIKYPVF